MKTDVKEKRKRKGSKPELSKFYVYFREYAIPLIVLLFAYVGYKIRAVTSSYKTFLDPDTFFHFEMYRQAIAHWIPKYYAYAEPPMGIKAGGYLGLYTMQALFYKVTHALFGWSELHAFKVWPPFVGAMIVIAVFLVGRKLHSNWAGFWGAALIMFMSANITKTMSGNNRGEGPFMMFFLFAVYFLLVYLDEKAWNWKKIAGLIGFLVLSPIYMGVWNGSQLGIMVLLTTAGLTMVTLFTLGEMEKLRRFVKELYPVLGASLIIGYVMAHLRFVGIGGFLVFAIELYVALGVLIAVMLYGKRFGLNYSDKKHRLGTVVGILILGFLAFYAYFGRDLLRFLGQATRSTPLYQTVAELQAASLKQLASFFSVKSKDGLIFVLSLGGLAVMIGKMLKKFTERDYTVYKEFFILTYYLAVMYLLHGAIRFTFQASAPVAILAGVAIGFAFVFVENMKEKASTKALYAVFLILLFLPLPYVGASYADSQQKNMMQAYSRINPSMPGSVPEAWTDALFWLRDHSSPYATVLSWWDYGYWEESSLLSHRRAVSDGGHAYDRRYIIAKFFSHSDNAGEVDLEAWEDKYVITFLDPFDGQSDFGKFNAIAYLGGAISHGEGTAMFGYVPYTSIIIQNNTVYVNLGNNQYIKPVMTIDMVNGKVYKATGTTAPYVLYVVPYKTANNKIYPIGILAYKKIAFSNYVRLALHLTFSVKEWDAQKLFANFKLVYTGYNGYLRREGVYDPAVMVYEFTPFAIYRMDFLQNGTWEPFYSTTGGGKLPTGNQTLRLWISAFGRDVKNGTIIFEAYNGTKLIERKVVARNVYINHLNETPVEIHLYVPKATKYRFLLIQDGPVGVTNGPVYVNGKLANPSWVIAPGQSGTIRLTEAFDKSYTNVEFTLRGMLYYYVAPNGTDIYKPNFYLEPHMDIVGYIPVETLKSVKKGDNVITGRVSVPADLFTKYINELKKKYGDKVVIVSERIEPIFITEKTYVLWEGS
ncbi:STT3 domain-containing protein [Thermococcus henrietii]|uniref:STT3 domain-containing protein n=1 Tax=Thermococcus henrietii TaxID=2016361 RepID=UPI000C087F63|nr:STT3 domain-containing protein [Thermococcus henrietii]